MKYLYMWLRKSLKLYKNHKNILRNITLISMLLCLYFKLFLTYAQSSYQSDILFEFILQVQEYKDSLKTKVICTLSFSFRYL